MRDVQAIVVSKTARPVQYSQRMISSEKGGATENRDGLASLSGADGSRFLNRALGSGKGTIAGPAMTLPENNAILYIVPRSITM